jgi:hypothetical protein
MKYDTTGVSGCVVTASDVSSIPDLSTALNQHNRLTYNVNIDLETQTLGNYQTGVAVVEAQLPGYVTVGVLLDGRHVGELDRVTEVIKLQLQARGFLRAHGNTMKRSQEVIQKGLKRTMVSYCGVRWRVN